MEKTIRVYAVERKASNGSKFMSFSCLGGDDWYSVKFTRNVASGKLPTENGYYLMTVDNSKVNISHKGDYPALWVDDETVKFVRDVDFEAKRKAERQAEIDTLFDGTIFD